MILDGRAALGPEPARLPPADRFHCRLDDQPGFLVPARLVEPLRPTGGEGWVANPGLWLSRWGAPPSEVGASMAWTARFHWDHEAVWVADIVRGGVLPFCAGAAFSAWMDGLRPGLPPPRALPEAVGAILAAAQVLVVREQVERERRDWALCLTHAARLFGDGYAPLAGLLHPFHLGSLRRYYRWLVRTGRLRLGDGQSPRRYVAHNESVARFFHHHLAPVVSAVAGRRVVPSYVYAAAYGNGAELPRHTDRPQCEYSITLLLDYAPEPPLEAPWPIHLELPSARVTVFQAVGDALLYRGRTLPHHREPLESGHSSTSLLFHYVDEDFDGPLD